MIVMVAKTMAQSYSGTVVDNNGNAIDGVSVLLCDNKRPLGFGRTNSKGEFTASVQHGNPIYLQLRKIGFSTLKIPLSKHNNGRRYVLKEKAVELKEIKVSPNKANINGDTVTYLVSAYMQKQDRSIADVIAKIPGIDVKQSGQITVNGQPINKFYVEGMDLLGGKYSLASENIAANKVRKIQVLNNHQPVRALRNVRFSEQAALNIVLKDEAKNVWQGLIEVGGGHSIQGDGRWMRSGRLLAMLFARKRQSITMFKTDNTGKDISHEISDLAGSNLLSDDGDVLSNISIPAPALNRERYTFNNSHVIATNWLFKPSKDTDLRFQIDGLIDRTDQNAYRQTELLDVGSEGVTITEKQNAFNKRNEWKGELLYKLNSDKIYFSNSLEGYADINYSRGLSLLNGMTVRQAVEPRKRYVTDNMAVIRNLSKGHSLSFNTKLRYSYLPGYLLLHDGNSERLGLHHFSWKSSTYFRHKIARAYITWNVGEEYNNYYQDVDNPLLNYTDKYSQLSIYATPSFSYKSHSFNIVANSKLSWNYRKFNDKNHNHFAFEPSLMMSCNIGPYIKAGLDYFSVWSPNSLRLTSSSPVYSDYITLTEGLGYMSSSNIHMLSHSWKYNNPAHGLSAYASFTFNHIDRVTLYNSSYVDGFYIRRASNKTGKSNTYSLNSRIAKSIGWGKLSLALNGSISWYRYNLLLNEIISLMRQRNSSVGIEASWHPLSWLSIEENSRMNFISQKCSDESIENSSLRYFKHSLNIFLMPGKWQIECDNDLYHSNDKSISNNYFCDLKVSYREKEYEIGVSCNNIFGTHSYERTILSDYMRTYTINVLRPRALLLTFSITL